MLLKNVFNLTMVLFFLSSCSHKNKFNLEEQATIKFKEAYYQEWSSGIKGGGSGWSIHLVLADKLSEDIELKGVFFRKEYSSLKIQQLNYYQGFIKGEGNWDKEEIQFENENRVVVENTKKEEKISFPFDLKINEAVISYLNKGEIKYLKLKISKKEISNIPM